MENENKTTDAAEKTGCCGGGGDKKEGCCKKKGCCTTLLLGGVVGGIVMFVYYLAARKFLPWHEKELLSFTNTHAADIGYFLLCFVGAVLLTKVLKKAGCPIFKSMIIGLLVAGFSYMPNVIFFHFPMHNALAGMFNDFVAFTLAGFAIASLVLKTGGCKMGHSCGGGEGKDGGKTGCCH